MCKDWWMMRGVIFWIAFQNRRLILTGWSVIDGWENILILVNKFSTIQLENLSKGLKDGPCSVINSGRQTADVYLPPMTNGCKWVKGGSALILNPHALSFGIQWWLRFWLIGWNYNPLTRKEFFPSLLDSIIFLNFWFASQRNVHIG